MAACKNCTDELTGAFCATCGQSADTQRISWKWFGHEVVTSVFSVDHGFLFTLKELFTRPGYMLRDYLEGKRKPYFKPLAFLLVMAAVYSLLYRFMPPAMSVTNDAMQKSMEWMNSILGQYYALAELAFVPLFAACTWLFLRKYGHNFTEHLVIQAFLSGQRIFFNSIAVPFNLLGTKAAMLASSLLAVAYAVAMLVAFIQLYRDPPVVSVMIRTLLAFVLFFLIIGILGFAAIFVSMSGSTVG